MTTSEVPRRVRLARRLALNPVFRRVGKVVVPRVDRVLHRVSRGRVHLADAAVPTLVLVVAGRRSGQPRSTPLAYVPDGDDYLVVGSNWGQAEHPVWTLNLLAAETAVVEAGGRRVRVAPELLEGEARAEAWARLRAVWPTYDDYTDRAGGRELRVFRLRPTP
jgi:deazaflavin-dependent oxidoreductase (nitroreductase family)